MPDRDKPGRYEVTNQQIQAALERAQRSFPGIVVKYDAQTLRAEVQPALRIRTSRGQQVTPSTVVIPVAWPSWGEFGLQGKLSPGDEVIVECMDRNWLAWLSSGGVADYNAIGGRQAGYAVAKPMQVSDARRPTPLGPGEELRFGRKDGLATVVVTNDGRIRLQGVDVELALGAGIARFLTDLHTGVTAWIPVPNDGAASLKTSLAPWLALIPPTGGPPPP